MTVQELIEILNNVEDKSREVYIESEGSLTSTCLDDGFHLLLLFGDDN